MKFTPIGDFRVVPFHHASEINHVKAKNVQIPPETEKFTLMELRWGGRLLCSFKIVSKSKK